MTNREVGDRLKFLREQRKMNKNELANAAGVSPTYVYQLEKGEKSPTVEYLGYLCEALGVTLFDFFEIKNEDRPYDDKVAHLSETQRKLFNDFLNSLT